MVFHLFIEVFDTSLNHNFGISGVNHFVLKINYWKLISYKEGKLLEGVRFITQSVSECHLFEEKLVNVFGKEDKHCYIDKHLFCCWKSLISISIKYFIIVIAVEIEWRSCRGLLNFIVTVGNFVLIIWLPIGFQTFYMTRIVKTIHLSL